MTTDHASEDPSTASGASGRPGSSSFVKFFSASDRADPTIGWLRSVIAAVALFVTASLLRQKLNIGLGGMVCILSLLFGSLYARAVFLSRSVPRLSLTLAAESIVSFGIFCLIISIAVALLGASELLTQVSAGPLKDEEFRRLVEPFVEGLGAAALAPLLATLLRHQEASLASAESGETGMAAAAGEAERLAGELKAMTINIRGVNADFASAKTAFLAEKAAFEKALGGSVAATGALSETLMTEADRLKLAFQRLQAEATGFADASHKGRDAVGELGKSLSRLSGASDETRQLLDALAKLIESVERFVKPDR